MALEVIDRPFGLPVESREISIDLPFPPSTNRLHGRQRNAPHRVFRRKKYEAWLKAADNMVLLHGSYPRPGMGEQQFDATFLFDEDAAKPRGDLDNRIKGLLDWIVSREIIADDRFCRRIVAQWVAHAAAPHGCRVILRSWHG